MKATHSLALALALATALVACRPHVPETPAPPRAPVASHDPVALSVCWIETAKFGPATASSLLIRHPEGDVLVDAGNSVAVRREIDAYDGKTRRYLRWRAGLMVPTMPLGEHLRRVGVPPAAIRWFLPTHAHIDHVGGYRDVPEVPVLMHPAEIALVERGAAQRTFEVVPAHANALHGHMVPLPFTSEPYEIFDEQADLFGDGSVVVVPLPGHTPGSIGVFVTLADGRRVLHVGDAANTRRELDKGLGKHPAMQRTDKDPDATRRTVARLHALAEQVPGLQLLPAHDRKAWQSTFGSPAEACPAPPA